MGRKANALQMLATLQSYLERGAAIKARPGYEKWRHFDVERGTISFLEITLPKEKKKAERFNFWRY